MSPKKAKKANELPYIPLGPFQWRIPGIHYRVEYVEFFQGLILGATALSSIPYLTDNLRWKICSRKYFGSNSNLFT